MPERKYKVEVIAPFGPVILRTMMPPVVVDCMNEMADSIRQGRKHRERRDWSSKLAGNVRLEVRVTDLVQSDFAVMHLILTLARKFALRGPNIMLGQQHGNPSEATRFKIRLQEVWINDMVAGDFSPVHFHTGCHFSCVGFLRVPTDYASELSRIAPNKLAAGCLQFIDSRTAPGASNMYLVRPEVGAFYMFPAWMLHCVYPFRSAGVRRTFSANISLSPATASSDCVETGQ